jgi:hypothetical protein
MNNCEALHNTQSSYVYNSQGQLTELSINDNFACDFSRYVKSQPNLMPKYQDCKKNDYIKCCNKAQSDITPFLVGNNYFNNDKIACKDNKLNGLWARTG